MSNIASETGSVRSIAKMFENISTPMFFLNVFSKQETVYNVKEKKEESTDVDNDVANNLVKEIEMDSIEEDIKKNNMDNEIVATDDGNGNANENDKTDSSKETKVYKHLKTYPIINSWIKIFHWVPLPRIIRPRLMDLAYSNQFSNFTTSIDTYLDNQLNTLDTYIPSAQTLRMRDIRNIILDNPIIYVTSVTTNSIKSVSNLTQKGLIDPSRSTIHSVRELRGEYISFMGNQPLIRSRVTPVFKDLNNMLVKNINIYLPAITSYDNNEDKEHIEANIEISIDYVSLEDNTCEALHTLQLINLAVLRTRPILQKRLRELSQVPSNTRKYVTAVYKESEEHRGEGRIVVIIATLETIRKVATDGYNTISSSRFFQFLESKPTVQEKLSIAEEIDNIETTHV